MLFRSKSDGTIINWTSWFSQVVNPNILLGLGIEKVDHLEPQFRVISQLKVRQDLTFAGGWILGNGSIDIAILYNKKNNVYGIHMSNHPFLGYGIELMMQYGKY